MSRRSNSTLTRYRSITLPNANKQSILPKEFSISQKIGSGLTAQVYRCRHTQFGNVCAKIINNSFLKSTLGDKLIKNQISILEKLSHKNILKIYQTFKYNDRKVIITQFCEGGDLQKEIKIKKKIIEKDALQIFSQIVSGCKYLLQQNIIHRDIKPANILLKSKGKQALIADFGFAVQQSDKQLMKKNVGSPLYMAPQALSDLNYTQKSEVFSLGILLYQMLTGKTPWSAVSQRDLLNKMKTIKPVKPQNVSQKTWVSVLEKCLQIQAQKRISIKNLGKVIKQILQGLNGNYGRYISTKNYQSVNDDNELNNQKNNDSDKQNQSKFDKNSQINLLPKILSKQKTNNFTGKFSFSSRKESDSLSTRQLKGSLFKKLHHKTQLQTIQDDKNNQKMLSTVQIIKNINPRCYSFLPEVLVMKFEFIIQKYDFIINNEFKDQNKNLYKPKPHSEIEKDLMIAEVYKCEDEKELCQIIVGFIRRLLRFTKNYINLNSKHNAGYLDLFYKRVTQIST